MAMEKNKYDKERNKRPHLCGSSGTDGSFDSVVDCGGNVVLCDFDGFLADPLHEACGGVDVWDERRGRNGMSGCVC